MTTDDLSSKQNSFPFPPIYVRNGNEFGKEGFWPPRIVWSRELGWLNIRDPWGSWHSIPAKEAPSGYVHLANQAKYGGSR